MKKNSFVGRTSITASFILFSLLSTSLASARNTFYDISVEEAVKTKTGQKKLLDVPFYMLGQEHPSVDKDFSIFKSNKRSAKGFGNIKKCQVAFISAIISLQNKAKRMGGDGLIDVMSVTRRNNLESPDKFRCLAGANMVNVELVGRVVTFSKEKGNRK